MSILIVLEQRDSKLIRPSLEALTAGQEIARALSLPLQAAVIGADLAALAADAAAYDLEKVLVLEHPLLAAYTPDGYASALEQVIRSQTPRVVVFPHTYQVRDYAPKIATRFGASLVSDVTAIKTDASAVVFVRQLFQGKLNGEIPLTGETGFVSIQAGAFRPAESAACSTPLEKVTLSLEPDQIRSQPEERFREAARSVDLGAAELIVSVGRGIREKENMPIVEELARALGAELAASRPICDNGWLPMERQVGSSGQTVSPKIYFAIGISGAIQHLVGMKGSRTVVAINKDENAPIFEMANYAVVGDLFEVVPALVEAIKKAKA